MLTSKGHIQPHHTNLPRRHLRKRSPPNPTRTDYNLNRAVVPRFTEHTGRASTDSTKPTETSASSDDNNPLLLHRRSFTPVTSPLDFVLPEDAPPDKFPLLPSQRHGHLEVAGDLTSPQRFHPSASVIPNAAFAGAARGHLGPHTTNLPRRLNRAQKERETIRRRCLQEFIPASGIWIAFDLRTNAGGDDDDRLRDDLALKEKEEKDWMWEEEFGFTGTIRVQIGRNHGRCGKSAGKREELELIIGKEEIRAYDDLGIPVLTEDQLDNAAAFLDENRRRWDGKGKLLITTPPSRPVEALSVALFAFSLLSISASPPSPSWQPHSYPTEMRLLPGILELKQSQELDNCDLTTDTEVGEFVQMRIRPNYTPIHLTLWHIHDLMSLDQDDDHTMLKQEWRGALSQDGIEKLEKSVALWRTV